MSPAVYWLVGGLAFCALELLAPGAMLLWVGVAALPVGLLSLLLPDLAIEFQLAAFAVLAVISVALARKFLAAPTGRRETINTGASRFIGEIAQLSRPIVNGSGQIRLGDTVWAVRGPDTPDGARVRVTGSDGAILIVEPL